MMDFWIILTASLASVACSLLGSFLILRNMAMIGDAISHAVLPGIVIAFLFSGSLDSVPMLLGAAAFGLITTFLIETFNKKGGLQKDASIGITFTWLFAIGVILLTIFADQVDLDQDCVLFGEIAYVALEKKISLIPGVEAPFTVWSLLLTVVVILLLLVLGYRGLFLTTFDASYATVIGISTGVWHYLLMSAVSITTVVSFESVGAVLVVALLTAPAASAYLITNKLKWMLVIACSFGILASILGYYFAVWLDASVAAAITAVLGLEFLIVFLLYSKVGLIHRITRKKTTEVVQGI